jgi:hypothetical protein
MATNARRSSGTAKKAVPSKTRRVAVPKPAPPVEPEELETEDVEEEFYDDTEEEAPEEVESVNEEVPDSIKQLAEDAMAAAEDEELDLDSMPVLTIEMIRDAKDRTTEWIPVKDWGGKMQVRSLSANAMFEMLGDDKSGITEEGFSMDLSLTSMQKAIIMNGVVQPVITEAGFTILMEKSTAPVMSVLQAIMRVSKLGKGASGKDAVTEEVDTFRPTGE